MNAATAILVLALSSTTYTQNCEPRVKPWYDCTGTDHGDRFFAHPADCTFLVSCKNAYPIVLSLCEGDDEDLPLKRYDHTLGCPWVCKELHAKCSHENTQNTTPQTTIDLQEDTTIITSPARNCPPRPKPTFNCTDDTDHNEFAPHPDDCTFLVACINQRAVIASLCKDPSNARSVDMSRLDHAQGCAWKCAELYETCPWAPTTITTTTTVTTPATVTTTNTVTTTTPPICPPAIPPKYDCAQSNRPQGQLFAHPEDCTYLVACVNGLSIVGSLCEDITKLKGRMVYDHALGCPWKCVEMHNSGCLTHSTDAYLETQTPKMDCPETGIFPVLENCTLAYGCAYEGMPAFVFSICEAEGWLIDVPFGCHDQCDVTWIDVGGP